MDKQTGATYVYSIKEVVERANDPVQEISLDEAKKISSLLKLNLNEVNDIFFNSAISR